jgi:hypothetical protein
MERFTTVDQCFRKAPKDRSKPPELAQNAKGSVYVQIYAIYEYTVRTATLAAIQQIAGHSLAYCDVKPHLLAIFLDPQVRSLRDCGDGDTWKRRFDLLKKMLSDEAISAVDVVPHDGSHFRHTQVELILELLGLSPRFTYRKRHLYKIDEIVENRNSITHGNETAVAIGQRYSRSDVAKDIRLLKSICLRLISLMSEHCSDPALHKV